jgi:hypothetical protein
LRYQPGSIPNEPFVIPDEENRMQRLSGLLAAVVLFSQGSPALRVGESVAIGEINAESGSHADGGGRGNLWAN